MSILNRDADATERLIALAETLSRHRCGRREGRPRNGAAGRSRKRLEHALVKGIDAHVVDDTEEAPPSASRGRSR